MNKIAYGNVIKICYFTRKNYHRPCEMYYFGQVWCHFDSFGKILRGKNCSDWANIVNLRESTMKVYRIKGFAMLTIFFQPIVCSFYYLLEFYCLLLTAV